jgi:4-hydroxybutyrate CoA-transferase
MRIHKLASEAVAAIQSGNRVFVHGGAATPLSLLNGVAQRADQLRNVEFTHLHIMGNIPYFEPKYRDSFKASAFFVGANMRPRFEPGQFDYIPCFLSEIPQLFRSGHFPLDVALLHVSPPDEHGFCTLGTSVDIAKAAAEKAKVVIAQINPNMPRVLGDGIIHISKIHHAIEVNDPLPEDKRAILTEEEKNIAKYAASLIDDGATLQMGIGAIPDGVLGALFAACLCTNALFSFFISFF